MTNDSVETMTSDSRENITSDAPQVVCFQGCFIAAGFHLKGI